MEMTDSNGDESLNESSFVILGQGSLPFNLNHESSWNGNEDFVSNIKDGSQVQKSASYNELPERKSSETKSYIEDNQEKLHHLLQENYHLRETLNQNNLAIKSQLDTFIMWQHEVLKTHETHKQKFLETKELILKLRAENTNLKKLLDNGSNKSLLINGDNTQVIASVEGTNKIDSLKREVKKFEEMCSRLTDQNEILKVEKYELVKKLKESESLVFKISQELEDSLRENKFPKENGEELKKNSMMSFSFASLPKSETWNHISNTIHPKELDEEKAKETKLNTEHENSKTDKIEEESKLSTTEELKHCISNLNDMNVSINKQNERFMSMLQCTTLAEEYLNALKINKQEDGVDSVISKIKDLKSHLHQEEATYKEKQEKFQELQGKFCNLLKDYKDLQRKLKRLETNCSNNQKYKDEITTLTQELAAKDDLLTSTQQECEQLKDNIKKLNSECEEAAALRLQMELYKTDFNDEREAREKLAGEKEEMAEEIRFLRTKIENMEQQNSTGARNEEPKSPLETPAKGKKYMCPKCMFSFSDLNTCHNHIDECLNIHFYP